MSSEGAELARIFPATKRNQQRKILELVRAITEIEAEPRLLPAE